MALPTGPLMRVINARGGAPACLDRAGIHDLERERLQRRLRWPGGVSVESVDQWCCDVLKDVLPQDIYGEAWWTAR